MAKKQSNDEKSFNRVLNWVVTSGILVTMLSLPIYGVIAKYAWTKIEVTEKRVYKLEKDQAVQKEINKRLEEILKEIKELQRKVK